MLNLVCEGSRCLLTSGFDISLILAHHITEVQSSIQNRFQYARPISDNRPGGAVRRPRLPHGYTTQTLLIRPNRVRPRFRFSFLSYGFQQGLLRRTGA